jgi:uncharacterized protein (DUF2336 family)
VATLRRIADLFLNGAGSFDNQQVAVFDDVLLHLIRRVENKALVDLGTRLAPADSAPRNVIQHLARHDDMTIAAPVLSTSPLLTDSDLVEIAETKSQGHLFAISSRAGLGERVTDVLVDRGNRKVLCKLANNAGAAFSERGFTHLVRRAEADDVLAEGVGLRLDIPTPLLHQLLTKATENVRARILEAAPLESREEIGRILASASNQVVREVIAKRDFTRALEVVSGLQKTNRLNEAAIVEFATQRKYEETVVGLAALCGAPIPMIERLMKDVRYDGLLVVCKSAELKWATVNAILANRFSQHSVSLQELHAAKVDFIKLSVVTAQRVMRFWLVRETAARNP